MEDVTIFVSIQLVATTVSAILDVHWSITHFAMVIIPLLYNQLPKLTLNETNLQTA